MVVLTGALLAVGKLSSAESGEGAAADPAAELAKQLSSSGASLTSLSLRASWDYGIGANDTARFTLNARPVIPLTLTEDMNLIIPTIIRVIDKELPGPGIKDVSGMGDIMQSFFFSPKESTSGGWILGAGPILFWPSATDDLLGSEQWGAGPTALALKQSNGWTFGVLGMGVARGV